MADLMHWAAQQQRPVAFAATCSSAAALPPALRAAGCLDSEVKVPPFGVQGRAALLLAGFKAKGLGFSGGVEEVEGLAGKDLEGFDAKDLQLVVDRAVHAALSRQMAAGRSAAAAAAAGAPPATATGADSSFMQQRQRQQQQQQQQLAVTAEDVASALAGFVPAAFWRAGQQRRQQQQEGGIEGWQDVGGLGDAVAALHEALVLPAKYGQLLAAAPLRLRTGLLLFGPPGCGKTHVVAAAVAATGARLISVKGPELLNKYIGQSEAAVRELFARAAAAAPCVLFFDEFDAIAPPRGHDSTGVTDRVVNQLLTELDGVEGLSGVAVLAATSRPDLIDAALLRPGRLDRMVFCGFPDAADRLAILRACARKLPLTPGVNFEAIARLTVNFTGADMAAVLSEAQLLAVHEQLDKAQAQQQQDQQEDGDTGGSTSSSSSSSSQAPVLRMEHLQRALARARPSLPATEQARLAAVYARFQQGRDPGLSNRQALDKQQQRVKHATLA
ncbi:P-loop containing nucleoside triphosphate hydrolase protein [Scenedesmus sp. NREL 46B-D3]|nr:P-loop containing nucleoside triphosphate hydrolase protein [Scenedesmus sp. NREL 46B-D3]